MLGSTSWIHTTRAVILPAGNRRVKLSMTVTPGRVGYAKVTFSKSICPRASDGCAPDRSNGSISDWRSIRAKILAAADAALLKSIE